jgi:glycosyltransferase involved in cell wall biosynthesis
MRIAQIAPIAERLPPAMYGGIERVIHTLTEGLVRKGHDVTLFATGDSSTSAKLSATCSRSLRTEQAGNIYGLDNVKVLEHITHAYSTYRSFDIIHDHTAMNNIVSLPLSTIIDTPVVITLHGPIDERYKEMFNVFTKPRLISISHAQVKGFTSDSYLGNVYNGLEMRSYPFSADNDGYLLFVGRMSAQKGVHHAIEVAHTMHLPLIIAAKLDPNSRYDPKYFAETIRPMLSESIRWVGEVDETQRNLLMSRALCLVHPATWPEPFGLTLIEAMACGCPVVAFARGAIPEIIVHGRTGFVVDDVSAMAEAVANIHAISRYYCRTYALENFNAEKMVGAYESLYTSAISGRSK